MKNNFTNRKVFRGNGKKRAVGKISTTTSVTERFRSFYIKNEGGAFIQTSLPQLIVTMFKQVTMKTPTVSVDVYVV